MRVWGKEVMLITFRLGPTGQTHSNLYPYQLPSGFQENHADLLTGIKSVLMGATVPTWLVLSGDNTQ